MKFIHKEDIDYEMQNAKSYHRKPEIRKAIQINVPFQIDSLEGILNGKAGDYIIRGTNGEYYICDQEIFKKTYEENIESIVVEKLKEYKRNGKDRFTVLNIASDLNLPIEQIDKVIDKLEKEGLVEE